MRSLIEKYGCMAAIVTLPLAIVLAYLSPTLLDPANLCKKDEGGCVVEWVAAMGGYFAVFAAFVTIRKMQQQMAQASQHQKENLELEVTNRLTIARSFASLTETQHLVLGMFLRQVNFAGGVPTAPVPPQNIQAAIQLLRNLLAALEIPEVAQYEALIGASPNTRSTRLTAQGALRAAEPYEIMVSTNQTPTAKQLKDLGGELAAAIHQCDTLMNMNAFGARCFIEKWESRIK